MQVLYTQLMLSRWKMGGRREWPSAPHSGHSVHGPSTVEGAAAVGSGEGQAPGAQDSGRPGLCRGRTS